MSSRLTQRPVLFEVTSNVPVACELHHHIYLPIRLENVENAYYILQEHFIEAI